MERLIVVRHGESECGVRGTLNGDPSRPCPLTAVGREQAHAVGEALGGERIDLAATTPFERTIQTADLALAGRTIPRLVVAELSEHPAGDYEGRPLREYIEWAHASDSRAPVPGTDETRVALAARIGHGYRCLLERPEETVAAFLHKLPICYLLAGAVQRLPPFDYAEVRTLSRAEVEAAVVRLETWAGAPTW